MNRQQGNEQRKKKLKNERDKKLNSNVYKNGQLEFPKASSKTLEELKKNTVAENNKQLIIKLSLISIIFIALFMSLYLWLSD
ncbi:hypothetical protein [Tenacibaculum sp. 190524A05c]|uniref:hypothetical protein n=1 Tax=Tenacibaculum platacis TaxID=3137852 RepID=UPI0032B117E9